VTNAVLELGDTPGDFRISKEACVAPSMGTAYPEFHRSAHIEQHDETAQNRPQMGERHGMNSTQSRNRSWRYWLFLVFCQVGVVLLLAEGAVRVIATQHRGLRTILNASNGSAGFDDVETLEELMDRSMLGFSPFTVEYGFVLNSRSFRTAEYSPGGAADRFRVVALGDSFTFASGGLPHEDHWTTVTENELGKRMDRPAEVLRLGVPGTGPAFQLRLWEVEAAKLQPDLVVIGFFVGNDFVDHQDHPDVFDGERRGAVTWLADMSALFRVTRNLIRVTGSDAGIPAASEVDRVGSREAAGRPVPGYRNSFNPNRPTFDHDAFIEIEARRIALCLKGEAEAFDELAARAVAVVTKLVAEVEAGGARCLVMVIPDQYQLDQELVDDILRSNGRSQEDYDLDRPQRALVPALTSAGVEVLDLLPVFRSVGSDRSLYRPRDTHWNRRGNLVAAAALADAVNPAGRQSWDELFIDGMESGDIAAWDMQAH